ncbi:protein unc-45 homolog B [Chrysoperla carnea]|uniref:protein unc-45 homolog B n=1 Tax=Chrysoperla carnea TaxID=189513 RepID=UPI001D07335B|nr:protein unc-45 homolog B [Chrysoperla carnea]
MGATIVETAETLKDMGNEAFKNGEWDLSIDYYTKAIKKTEDKESKEMHVYYKNRAAAYLKKEKYLNAVSDCDKALEIVPTDPKALFRRSQALESLERYEEAYRDARQVLNVDPTNKAIQPVLARLHTIVQERHRLNASTSTKVTKMIEIAFKMEEDREKRETAMKNLLVLARESIGAEIMYKEGVVQKINQLIKVEKKSNLRIQCVRIIGELCRNSLDRTKGVISIVGIPWFLEIINSNQEEDVNAAQYCMQTIINSYSGMENKPDSKPIQELCEKHKSEIDTLLSCLLHSVTNRTITGLARDSIMELLIKNIHWDQLNWAERLVELKGLERLMEVASELKEYKYESAMDITDSSRTIASVLFSKVYENMYYDKARENYFSHIQEYIKDKLLTPDIESKVRVTVAITTLLTGPIDVGNQVIAKEGVMEMILVMAGTEDVLQQKVACECIVAAASKKDKALAIIKQGVNILKELYKSKNDEIRIRALVGLCKLGSYGGNDATIRPFADGANQKLGEACRRFLINPKKDYDTKRWAAEGLSYLTLDAEVKEKLIEDRPAIKALIELAKTGNQAALYGVVTTLVNLCNAYEKQEMVPEMIELAKFAKQHIPEEHELDDADFVTKRVTILAKEGVTSALVALSKTESNNSKELIARVFNAICAEQELRGIVVQQGGAKVLLPMALEGTEKGKKHAAQALARIGVNINPEVAFPGQRMLEVVRPLINLLHPDCSGLENFEALLTLCNIASCNEAARQRILKDGGLPRIEHFMYEEHTMLCRAATQVITNMVSSPDVVKIYEGDNDRTKYLLVLCGDEDKDTAFAASGALATLTAVSEKCCKKIFELKSWLENIHCLLANPNSEIMYRGVYIVNNLINSSKEVAEKLIDTDVMEILMALTRLGDAAFEGVDKVRKLANEALKSAEKWNLIKKPEDVTEE